jgi:hypothetical protein
MRIAKVSNRAQATHWVPMHGTTTLCGYPVEREAVIDETAERPTCQNCTESAVDVVQTLIGATPIWRRGYSWPSRPDPYPGITQEARLRPGLCHS